MSRSFLKYCISILVAISLTACYTTRRVGLIQERDNLPSYEQGLYREYKLQKNDEIMMRVVTSDAATAKLLSSSSNYGGNMNNSDSYRIFEDGTVDLPFLSSVKIEGLTLQEAEQHIDTLLRDYVEDAFVKLSLSTGTFCVIGDAHRGYYSIYKERLTIYQALALCGGINETADFSHVKILRKTPQGTKIAEFDIRSKSIIDSKYYYIYPNDVIYLDVSKRRFWGVSSYTSFIGLISSSLSLLVSIWNLFK
ncbi:MAG: polysaccharide biosynthesis/export family protein [Paludibacteraceae bacterium]|nr:polysaccharide biosynthesis/export family protein [Paludibacteraceae bacterium]